MLGVDVNKKAVETINKGDIHIVEPDLDILVKSAVLSGKLRASLTPEEADVFIMAVPTPFQERHISVISYVEAATPAIGKQKGQTWTMDKRRLVVPGITSIPSLRSGTF